MQKKFRDLTLNLTGWKGKNREPQIEKLLTGVYLQHKNKIIALRAFFKRISFAKLGLYYKEIPMIIAIETLQRLQGGLWWEDSVAMEIEISRMKWLITEMKHENF